LEDEDDIFVGSAKSKYFDISRNANTSIVEDEFDKLLEKYAVMELLLSKSKNENYDVNEDIKKYLLQNKEKVDELKQDLYVEFTGDIVCRLDS